MPEQPFDRSKHVYRNDAFPELVKDAVRFFNGTPVHQVPPPEKFEGTGVYALYFTGRQGIYGRYGELNRLAYSYPIYVGKAVPKGWRKARVSDESSGRSNGLFSRVREHSNNIKICEGVEVSDFMCRFMIFEKSVSDMIGSLEAALIKIHLPLWNVAVDGFGNHTPGKGRFKQARSDWDVIHEGRKWAYRCEGVPKSKEQVIDNAAQHLDNVG